MNQHKCQTAHKPKEAYEGFKIKLQYKHHLSSRITPDWHKKQEHTIAIKGLEN